MRALSAIIVNRDLIACPQCQCTEWKVFRREALANRVVEHLCRCSRCNESFAWKEDKGGHPIP